MIWSYITAAVLMLIFLAIAIFVFGPRITKGFDIILDIFKSPSNRLYDQGYRNLYTYLDYGTAAEKFELFLNSYPYDPRLVQVKYYLVLALYKDIGCGSATSCDKPKSAECLKLNALKDRLSQVCQERGKLASRFESELDSIAKQCSFECGGIKVMTLHDIELHHDTKEAYDVMGAKILMVKDFLTTDQYQLREKFTCIKYDQTKTDRTALPVCEDEETNMIWKYLICKYAETFSQGHFTFNCDTLMRQSDELYYQAIDSENGGYQQVRQVKEEYITHLQSIGYAIEGVESES